MKRCCAFVAMLFLLSCGQAEARTWTQPYIKKLTEKHRLKVLPSTQPLSRATYATLLEQTFLYLPPTRTWKNFTDVSPFSADFGSMRFAYERGFLSGDGVFLSPQKPITRLEVMISLANGFQLPINPNRDRKAWLQSQFIDANTIPAYAVDPLAALMEKKIWLTTPDDPTSLKPDRPITYGEVAVLFYEMLALQKQVPPISPVQLKKTLPVVTRLEVSLSQRRVTSFRGAQKHKVYPIAVGRAGWETPTGTFRVAQLIKKPSWKNPFTGDVIPANDPDNPLGQYWIGFWTNGKDWSGFHGTSNRRSVGQAASHGCLRMYNEDIQELFPLVSQETIVKVYR